MFKAMEVVIVMVHRVPLSAKPGGFRMLQEMDGGGVCFVAGRKVNTTLKYNVTGHLTRTTVDGKYVSGAGGSGSLCVASSVGGDLIK